MDVRAALHVLDEREIVTVGFQYTDYTNGPRPVGFTQLLFGYRGQGR